MDAAHANYRVLSDFMRCLTHPGKRLCLFIMLLLSTAASGAELSLGIADIVAPALSARGIRLALPMDGSADLQIENITVRQHAFRHVHLRCAGFALTSVQVVCRKGHLDTLPGANLEFSYAFDTQRLQLALTSAGGESWQVDGALGERAWQVSVQLRNAQSKRLSPWLPLDVPLPAQGMLNGTLRVSGKAAGADTVNADMQLADVAFSDASGLHAAEKLRGNIKFTAKRNGAEWNWQGNVAWQSGELFWQPLYLRGGHQLVASGRFGGNLLSIENAVVDLPEVGRVQFSANWQQGVLTEGTLQGDKLALDKLFETYLKPFLENGTLAESALQGHADAEVQYRSGGLQALRLNLHEAGISDAARRYVLLGVNSDINWQAGTPSTADIAFAGGALLGAPIGKGQWTVKMNDLAFDVPQAVLPVLDGKLDLRDFHLHRQGDAWHWHFSGSLSPISMAKFSAAAGWPVMLGTLAGRIPDVRYDGGEISVEGALLFNVFDGTVVATKLKLADAFGRAPRLSGNLAMRNLDLDLLTRTFSFGNMQGRLDLDVNKLQLQDWQPVKFDARLYSSAGNYPKKISQKAVQNISSLGGAGAAAAIQRSYLGFFENFGYDRIGLSCVLRNDLCEMGGIEGSNHGPYAIISGAGIPAISVMGYNRAVSWGELVRRLKRVTQDEVKPVVK